MSPAPCARACMCVCLGGGVVGGYICDIIIYALRTRDCCNVIVSSAQSDPPITLYMKPDVYYTPQLGLGIIRSALLTRCQQGPTTNGYRTRAHDMKTKKTLNTAVNNTQIYWVYYGLWVVRVCTFLYFSNNDYIIIGKLESPYFWCEDVLIASWVTYSYILQPVMIIIIRLWKNDTNNDILFYIFIQFMGTGTYLCPITIQL